MSDGRGISLRTKRSRGGSRPTISAPKQISGPIQQQAAAVQSRSASANRTPPHDAAQAQARPILSTTTSDQVRRRYSTRFNHPPQDFDFAAESIPSVPILPDQYGSQVPRARAQSPARSLSLGVDVKAFRDPNLHAEQYVANVLVDAAEKDVNEYQAQLRRVRNRASQDLQQNVFQNRAQFIKISKEAEKLKGEMRALKNLMADLKTNTTALRAASSGGLGGGVNGLGDGIPSTLSKRDKRSSVADRTAMWNSQLQALWKSVEGSQKFLPAYHGRHVIQNAGLWIELDHATWKSRRAMQIILLNDHLLVASRKKRKVEGNDSRQAQTKLVADRCWPLLDVEMVDLVGSSESVPGRNKLADAISIRGAGQESFVYRTEKQDDGNKTSLMMNFRKAVEELRRGLRSEMENTNKAKETINYFASRDPGLLRKAELLETLSDVKDMLIDVDGKQQNLRWVESQVDELDIDVALQRFDSAVPRVDTLNSLARSLKSNPVAQDFISFKAEERANKLATLITRSLVDTHNEVKKTKQNVTWLATLGFEDRAREAYLEARSVLLDKRSRQCIFEGSLKQYIWEISFVYFSIIRNTVATFQTCFPPIMMSACVKWAKEQVDAFNIILARQLSGIDPESAPWKECMSEVRTHGALLESVGLDFRGLIGTRKEPVKESASSGPLGLGLVT